MKTIFSSIVSRICFIVSLSILIPVALSAQTSEDIKQYKLLAEQGDYMAQYNLGACYYNGHGVPQSYSEAIKWFRKAARQGYAVAQQVLNGLGASW